MMFAKQEGKRGQNMRTYQEVTERDRIYPLGMTVMGNRIHAAVAADGKVCRLLLFEKNQEQPELAISMPGEKKIGDVWNLTLEGLDLTGLEYCFEVDGKPMADPYGRSFCGWEHWGEAENVKRTLKCPIRQEEFDWEGDQPLERPFHETILYRIHTRGLTKHTSSKVRDKGTFAAIEAKIPYMKELGVTAVELMPMTEFQEVMVRECADGNPYRERELTGKLNYWGYTRSFAFAPKASYSSGREKHPVLEFKHLVKEFHKAGLEVVTELYFDGKEPQAYALDVVRFWVQEYHVDGIHLVGFPPLELIGNDPYLSRTKLFAQSWSGIRGGNRKHLAEYHPAFQNDMRRLLKGDEDQMSKLAFHIRQNPKEHGIVNYMANTNGFTMMDMVSYDWKHNEANGEGNQDGEDYNYSWNCGVEGPAKKRKLTELRKKQIKNAMLMLFLSQGTPLLLSGDEFGNSKSGNNNTYCQDNELSWINWNQKKTNQDIYEFTRSVIAFRKAHPVFHMTEEPKVMDYLACGHPDISYHGEKAWCPEFEPFRRQMGIMYCGAYARKAGGSADDYFYVAFNMHWEPHAFALPNLPKKMHWHLAVHTGQTEQNGIWQPGEEVLLEEQKQYEVSPRSIVVLIGK